MIQNRILKFNIFYSSKGQILVSGARANPTGSQLEPELAPGPWASGAAQEVSAQQDSFL